MGSTIKRLGLIGAGVLAGAVVPIAWAWGGGVPPVTSFDEISVKRINIVEPDGKYRLVLANYLRTKRAAAITGNVSQSEMIGRDAWIARLIAKRTLTQLVHNQPPPTQPEPSGATGLCG